jgi:hypothetical protein
MADAQNDKNVQLDLNNPVFQENWLSLDKPERSHVTDTLKKLRQLTWHQVYRDQGLKWEKITSVSPPKGIAAIYTLRITQCGPQKMTSRCGGGRNRLPWHGRSRVYPRVHERVLMMQSAQD